MGDPVGTLRQLGQTPLVPAPTLGKLERRVRRRRLRRRATVSGLAVAALAAAVLVVLRDDPERVVRTAGPDQQKPESPAPTDTAVTGGPIPRVWAQRPAPTSEGGMAALVSGVLAYDEAQDCLVLELEGIRYPVVWPAGTVGTSDGPGVVLRDGSTVRVGDEVSGGGGYVDIARQFQIPDGCVPSTGDVAVFNANDTPQVAEK